MHRYSITTPKAKPQQPEPTVPTSSKYGRSGKAAFKKWTENEYINAIPGTEYYDKWVRVFDAYYNRGLSGKEQYVFGESPVLEDEIEFPPFVFDKIYRAGKTDYEAQQKRKAKAETDTKPEKSGIIVSETSDITETATTSDFDNRTIKAVVSDEWIKQVVTNSGNDKETILSEIEKRIKQQIVDQLTSYEKSVPPEITAWYNSRMANDGNNEHVRSMAERAYEQLRKEDIDVRKPDQKEPERVQTDAVQTTSQDRGAEPVPTRTGRESRQDVSGAREDVPETIPNQRGDDLSGASREEYVGGHDGNEASSGRDTTTGRGRDERGLEGSRNYSIPQSVDIDAGGVKTKYKNNIAAIKLIKQLEAENRMATPSEQEVLSRYAGWGGISQVFDSRNKTWNKEYAELKDLLTKEEYEAARSSTLNAHYTDVNIIRGMYNALSRLGFEGGKILDPSTGTGRFIGAVPENLAHSKFTAIELDPLTAKIAKYLYPKSSIKNAGFETVPLPDNFFDLAISNVPFGNTINKPPLHGGL